MSLLLYNLFLRLYLFGIRIAAMVNAKAKNWLVGRKNWQKKIKQELAAETKHIWIHCSSLGEFEQGRPIIERLKQDYPQQKIVLTFFSPSGYEVRKDYDLADHIFYMPLDGYRNAKQFIKLVNPSLVIFVKYEFWYYYLTQLKKQNIPVILVAAAFRESQPFFKWYGGLFKKLLTSFQYIFVQDKISKNLLTSIGFKNEVMEGGDTRYDRVVAIASKAKVFPVIEQFKGNNHLLIAGSTWPKDEALLKDWLPTLPKGWKLIIAPHEIDDAHIGQVKTMFKDTAVLYSQLVNGAEHINHQVLVIDNIGMLSSLFSYGSIAYIGGGFQKGGIHNTLEPAVFGLPIIFGSHYEKFIEAVALVQQGYAFPINNLAEFTIIANKLMIEIEANNNLRYQIRNYIHDCTGATEKVMKLLAKEYFKTI